MLKLREAADQGGFHFRDRLVDFSFVRIEQQKLLLHRLLEFNEARAGHRAAHRDDYSQTAFDQHAFIDGEIHRARLARLIKQDSRHERRDAVEPVGQNPK